MRALSHAHPAAFEHRQALGYGSTIGPAGRSGALLRSAAEPRTGLAGENCRPGGAFQGPGPDIGPDIGSGLGSGQGHRVLDGGWDAVVGAIRRFGGTGGCCPGFTG